MNNQVFKAMLGATSALVLIQASPAFAQAGAANAPPAAKGDAGATVDVIVTARRVEERLQDVPISITVFNQQQLTNANIVNAQDLGAITPSLSSNTNFGSENSSFAIRGFVQDNGTQPSVGVYFADVVAPRGASNNIPIGDGAGPGSFFDLQNVQVLKGPQGTLFGRNTTGGAVLLVPQKPTSRFGGYVEGSYGNFDLRRVQGVLNVPFSDTARFRIGVDRLDRQGYTNNNTGIGPKHFEGANYLSVRASLVVDLAPNLENYTIFSYTHSNTTGTDQKLVACDPTNFVLGFGLGCPALARQQGTGFYTVQNTIPHPYTHMTQWQVVNTTTWRASDFITVKNIVSYAELRQAQVDMLFGTDLNLADLSPVLSAIFHAPITLPPTHIDFAQTHAIPGGDTAAQSTMTDELQLQGRTPDEKFIGQGGVYIEESDPLAVTGSQSPVFINCTDSGNFQCTDNSIIGLGSINYTTNKNFFHNFGVYAQGTYSLTDKLKLTGGIRYTRDSGTADGQLITYKFPTPNTPIASCNIPQSVSENCRVHYSESSDAPTWLVDLEYKPMEDILGYVKYTRGYRAGGISLQAPTGFSVFKPEKVDTYEVGLKTSFRGAVSGTFDVTGFYNDFNNQQLQLNLNPTISGLSPASSVFNAGKSRIYGVEVDGTITPFKGFTVNADYTYLNTKLDSIAAITTPPGSPYTVTAPVHAGDELALTPKNKVSITATYTLPLEEKIGRVSISANFTHTDKQISNYVDRLFTTNASLYNLRYLAARDLLNLNLNWNSIGGSPVDLAVFATNLTDQKYYSYVPGLAGSVGFETAQLGQPRMYGVRLRYSFGR